MQFNWRQPRPLDLGSEIDLGLKLFSVDRTLHGVGDLLALMTHL